MADPLQQLHAQLDRIEGMLSRLLQGPGGDQPEAGPEPITPGSFRARCQQAIARHEQQQERKREPHNS